ncbi:MAG: enoyl-ACP reductase [Pseudomonadaceae bacterium]|nr:enoyl-ACP reductase [Pseudomonadaceae bacterium]
MNTTPQLLSGKRGLIMGISNDWSLAWGIAQAAHAAGAQLVITSPNETMDKRVTPLAASLGVTTVHRCDVQSDADLADLSAKAGKLDFIVHAIAFAHKDELKGGITNTTREGFRLAMDVSCYSFIAVAKALQGNLNDGASLLTLSYLGGEKVVPNYNVMGVAKAALESATRYLAAEFGPRAIRVNALSAGPVKTLAASGIGDFKAMLAHHEKTAPLKRLTTQEDVANAALYLMSNLSSGTTGQTLYVDGGANILGPTPLAG